MICCFTIMLYFISLFIFFFLFLLFSLFFFFFNDTATTEIYTLSLHDALPISLPGRAASHARSMGPWRRRCARSEEHTSELQSQSNLVCRLLLEKKKKKTFMDDEKQRDLYIMGHPDETGYLHIYFDASATLESLFFFFNDTATTEIYTLSLHDALPI